jgi:hypothetical protein
MPWQKKNVQYQKSPFKQLFFEITIAKSKYLVHCCLYLMIPLANEVRRKTFLSMGIDD